MCKGLKVPLDWVDKFIQLVESVIHRELRTERGKVNALGSVPLVCYIVGTGVTRAPLLQIGDTRIEGTLPNVIILAVYFLVSVSLIPVQQRPND